MEHEVAGNDRVSVRTEMEQLHALAARHRRLRALNEEICTLLGGDAARPSGASHLRARARTCLSALPCALLLAIVPPRYPAHAGSVAMAAALQWRQRCNAAALLRFAPPVPRGSSVYEPSWCFVPCCVAVGNAPNARGKGAQLPRALGEEAVSGHLNPEP
jgi:uncharacterized membrane protein